MRGRAIVRRAGIAVAAVLMITACGASDDDAEPVVDTSDTSDTTDEGGLDTSSVTTTAAPDAPDAPDAPGGKPDVQIPEVIPTELVVTDLIEGSGPEAEAGDTVTVNYVGVRSADGFEFDNSYDRGQSFPVQLGAGGVIEGWDLGLVGARAGMRRQLDIPSELAYGEAERGDIRPGDALTFVIDVVSVKKPPEITAPPQADDASCAIDESAPQQQTFDEMQPFCVDPTKSYSAEIVTNFGPFTVELLPERAPQTVNNFVMLARHKYFDDTHCHRVLTDFVVQCGDPDASGFGGPGYSIPDELPSAGEYELGSIAMANAGPNSGGSQFFIITGPNGMSLPPDYSLFGQVVEGFDPVVTELNTLENPDGDNGVPPLETITIESVTITEV